MVVVAGLAMLVGLGACANDDRLLGLVVGDCFDEPETDEIVAVETVECDEPHDAEVFAILSLDGLDADVDEETLFVAAEERCVGQFEDYVGVDYLSSSLEVLAFVPTEDAWVAGDREVVCYVADIEGAQITGSVEGTGV